MRLVESRFPEGEDKVVPEDERSLGGDFRQGEFFQERAEGLKSLAGISEAGIRTGNGSRVAGKEVDQSTGCAREENPE